MIDNVLYTTIYGYIIIIIDQVLYFGNVIAKPHLSKAGAEVVLILTNATHQGIFFCLGINTVQLIGTLEISSQP